MKPILVTGGAKGLGAAICVQLAQSGHDVVVHYRESELEAGRVVDACRCAGVQAEAIQGDLSHPDPFLDAYLAKYSATKGLVNNVGNYFVAPLSKTPLSDWHALFQTNFFAPIALTKALLPTLEGVVNVGTCGLHQTKVDAPAYTITKSALLAYTRSLAKELASQNITVNMVSPGFLENAVDLTPETALPMGRPGRLDEVAQVVIDLFDPKSRYITGQNIEVAGGVGL